MFPTTKAMIRLRVRRDVKRRRLLVMEWTIRLKLRTRPLDLNIRTDQSDQIGGFEDFFDAFLLNQRHRLTSENANLSSRHRLQKEKCRLTTELLANPLPPYACCPPPSAKCRFLASLARLAQW